MFVLFYCLIFCKIFYIMHIGYSCRIQVVQINFRIYDQTIDNNETIALLGIRTYPTFFGIMKIEINSNKNIRLIIEIFFYITGACTLLP